VPSGDEFVWRHLVCGRSRARNGRGQLRITVETGEAIGDNAGVSARGWLSLERHIWIGDGEATNGESASVSCQDSRARDSHGAGQCFAGGRQWRTGLGEKGKWSLTSGLAWHGADLALRGWRVRPIKE
jgi:hypothetical protein